MSPTEHTVQVGAKPIPSQLIEGYAISRFNAVPAANDLEKLIAEQLTNPLEYPPLMASIIDDDHIAIGLEDGVPDGPAIAAEVIRFLIKHDVSHERITLVLGSTHRGKLDAVQSELQRRSIPDIQLLLHDPSNHDSHAYVAASKEGDPIYVQRELIDADVSIPIFCVRHPSLPHSSDPFGIAPTFTDAETQERWNLAWIEDSTTDRHEHERLGREVGWLAGVHFAIAAVPAADGSLSAVIAGQPEKIYSQSSALIRREHQELLGSCDLVIAFVEGPAAQQTWLSIARATTAAEPLCTPAARLVVCCDVDHVSRGVRDLHSDEPVEQANRRLLNSRVEDAFAAAVLRLASYRRSIYLYSSLTETETENLGLAYIQGLDDIHHLIEQGTKIGIVRGAQF